MAQRRTTGSSTAIAAANSTCNQFLGGKTFAWMTGDISGFSRNQQNNQHNRHATVSRSPAPPKPQRAPSPSTSTSPTLANAEPSAATTASSAVLLSPTPSDDRQRAESANGVQPTASVDEIPPNAATLPETLPWADPEADQSSTPPGERQEAELASTADMLPATNPFIADTATPYHPTPNGDGPQAEAPSGGEWTAMPRYSIPSFALSTPGSTPPTRVPPRPPGNPPKRLGESGITNPQKRLRSGPIRVHRSEHSTPTATSSTVSWPSLAFTSASSVQTVSASDSSTLPFAHVPTPNIQLGSHAQSRQPQFSQIQQPRLPLTPTPSPSHNMQNFDTTHLLDGQGNPLLMKMAEFLASIGGYKQLGSLYAELRFNSLQAAVREGDDLFLTLHQIYCLSTIDPEAVPASVRHHPNYAGAIQYLTVLLTSNQGIRQDVLKWFSEFPQKLQDFFLRNRQAMQILQAVESIMSGFQNKDAIINHCKDRGYPPLAIELRSSLGIRSCHLMKCVFTSIQRQIWGQPTTQNSDIHNSILDVFVQDLKILTDSLNAPGSTAHHSNHEHTINNFKLLIHNLMVRNASQVSLTSQGQRHLASNNGIQRENTIPQPRGVMNGGPSVGIRGTPVNAPQVPFGRQQQQQQAPPGPANGLRLQLNSQQPQQRNASGQSPTIPQNAQSFNPASPVPPIYVLPGNQRVNPFGAQSPVQASFYRAPLPPRTPSNLSHTTASTGIRAQSSVSATVPTPSRTVMPHFYSHPRAPPLPLPVNPQPESALHQAHLRSPVLRSRQDSLAAVICPKLYQFVGGFAVAPCRLKASFLQEFTFKLEKAEYDRIPAQTNSGNGDLPVLDLRASHRRYRLRACNRSDPTEPTTAEWVSTETTWASNVYLFMNGHPLEIRRKQHHAKDLPIDITDKVCEGINLLKFGVLQSTTDPSLSNWLYAVEIIDIKDHDTIKTEVQSRVRPSSDVLAALKRRLEGKSTSPDGNVDDELVITSSQLNINLFDPISASAIFSIPVRGRSCAHFECFDLETFLSSRPRKQSDWPTEVDVWRCPHCRGDARPQCLVVDGFMVDVRNQLEEMSKLDTRAITVKADGTWIPVEDPEEKKKDTPAPDAKPVVASKETSVPRQSEVIDLSD